MNVNKIIEKKRVEEAIKDASSVYEHPQDVVNDDSISTSDKEKILENWELDENRLLDSEAENMTEDIETETAAERIQQIQEARESLKTE